MSKQRLSRHQRFETKFRINAETGCWEWIASLFHEGYGQFYWDTVNGKEVNSRANRAAWQLYRGPIPDGLCALHECDNRKCVNPDHLFLGTRKDNSDDSQHKGRRPTGEQNYNFKCTPELTARVVELRSRGVKIPKIMQVLGISKGTVYRCSIISGYLPKPLEGAVRTKTEICISCNERRPLKGRICGHCLWKRKKGLS